MQGCNFYTVFLNYFFFAQDSSLLALDTTKVEQEKNLNETLSTTV